MSSAICTSPICRERSAACSRSPPDRQPRRRRIAYVFIDSLRSLAPRPYTRHRPLSNLSEMRISVSADERVGIAGAVIDELRKRGHEPIPHGALNDSERDDWAWASENAARDVAEGRAEQGIVCCWTGTGASIAANKVAGIRAALCVDAQTAEGARRWNDTNVLALSLRATSEAELTEILDAWFDAEASTDPDDRSNVEHLARLDSGDASPLS